MKIAFIPSTFLPDVGGAEIQAHNLANKYFKLFLYGITIVTNGALCICFISLLILKIVFTLFR